MEKSGLKTLSMAKKHTTVIRGITIGEKTATKKHKTPWGNTRRVK